MAAGSQVCPSVDESMVKPSPATIIVPSVAMTSMRASSGAV